MSFFSFFRLPCFVVIVVFQDECQKVYKYHVLAMCFNFTACGFAQSEGEERGRL